MAEASVRAAGAVGRRGGIGGRLANRPMAVKFLLVVGVTAAVAVVVAINASDAAQVAGEAVGIVESVNATTRLPADRREHHRRGDRLRPDHRGRQRLPPGR